MRIFIIIGLFFTLTGLLVSSCSKENEEDLIGDDIYCVDSLVSYQDHVRPILENNCYECHSTAIATNGIILDTYAGLTNALSLGFVLPQIRRDVGAAQMPFNRPKMSDCKIATIEKWVDEGMLNN
jgi:hypothetical protein